MVSQRRVGRSARRDARINPVIIHHPTLQRNIPVYDVLNAEGVEQIHDFAMRIVEQIGCEFHDEESIENWRKTSAEIDGYRVKIGREELMKLVAMAPSSYLHHARNPERTVRVGDGHGIIAPTYGAPFVLDMEGVRRYANMDDLNNFQKLNHMASSIHVAGGPIVEPVDIPVEHRHMYMIYSGLKYSDKPVIGNVTSASRAVDTIEMMKIVFGDEFATNNTVTSSLINSNSPLVWDNTMLGALKVYARNNQAVLCSPFSMAGVSTPASNVGTMGVVTAEALLAIAFGQLIRPGCPMVFGCPAMTVAMNSGAPVHGTPDSAMVQLMASAMARRYKVPHRSIANISTSKKPDMQAGYDAMWCLFPSFLSDANWMNMGAGMLEGALSVCYSKTVLDFEQLDAFYDFAQGAKFDDLDEIFETIKEVGPGGNFLGTAHTRKKNMFMFPSQNNVTFEQWEADGRKDAYQVGLEKARTWLERYQLPEMDSNLDALLLEYIAKRSAEIVE